MLRGLRRPKPKPKLAEAPPPKSTRIPDRSNFYDEQLIYVLEGVATDSGISYEFYKRRFLCGDGCCWVCGSGIGKTAFLCPLHAFQAQGLFKHQDPHLEDVKQLAYWSIKHRDFRLPQEFTCPKCAKRPQQKGDYLCAECRGF